MEAVGERTSTGIVAIGLLHRIAGNLQRINV
jgi:hypothetical protein